MAYPPTQLTITQTNGTDVLTIPANSSYSDFVAAIMKTGYWYPQNAAANPPASVRFVPASQISEIVAS